MNTYTKPLWKYWFSDEENLQYSASTKLTVCGASSSLHLLWPLSGFTSTVFSYPELFQAAVVCISLKSGAECALQNPGTSCCNSVVTGKNWMSNLAGNTELWQGAPWKSSTFPGPLFCAGPTSSTLNKPKSPLLVPRVMILLSSLLLSLRTMNYCRVSSFTYSSYGCIVLDFPAKEILLSAAGVAGDIACWPSCCPWLPSGILPVISIRWKRQQYPLFFFFACYYLLL